MVTATRITVSAVSLLAAVGLGAGVATYVQDGQAPQPPAASRTDAPAPAQSTPTTTAPAPSDVPSWTPTPHVPYAPAPVPETVDPRTAAPDGGPWKDYTQFDPTPAPGPTEGLPCQGSREVCYP